MVEHVVLFKVIEGISAEQKQFMVDALKRLRTIAGIVDMSVGINHSKEGLSKGFEVGMCVRFENEAALDAYGPSEVHQGIVAEIRPYFTDVTVVDYTV